MSEKRRPPRLHPGPLPEREPVSDPNLVRLTFTLTNQAPVSTSTHRARMDAMIEEISAAIVTGKTITLHDPDGSKVIINTTYVVKVDVR